MNKQRIIHHSEVYLSPACEFQDVATDAIFMTSFSDSGINNATEEDWGTL